MGAEERRRAMERYAEAPMEEATLLMRTSGTWRPGNFDKLVAKVGAVIRCDAPSEDEAMRWCVARAQKKHGVPYAAVGWEAERVALLRQVENEPFFQTVRGGLVVSLYNQKEVWPLFGYEGESASKGGYVSRGFDDITWL